MHRSGFETFCFFRSDVRGAREEKPNFFFFFLSFGGDSMSTHRLLPAALLSFFHLLLKKCACAFGRSVPMPLLYPSPSCCCYACLLLPLLVL